MFRFAGRYSRESRVIITTMGTAANKLERQNEQARNGERGVGLLKSSETKTVTVTFRCHRLSLPGGLSLPEAAITIAGTNPNPEP